VAVSDFGMSCSFEKTLAVFGTPLYQSPERLRPVGEMSRVSEGKEDVWSLGVTLYEMLFGETPFSGQDVYQITATIVDQILHSPLQCDPTAWDLIEKMLTVDPRKRISMNEVINADYVRMAPEHLEFDSFPEIEVPTFNEDALATEIKAEKCGPEIHFGLGNKLDHLQKRCYSSPF
jgi:serine/threonine-protein kinase 11